MSSISVILPYIQIVLSVLLIAAVLITRGDTEGAGGAFGGGDSMGGTYHTRRGFEKVLFNSTIVLAVLFALSALVGLIY